MAPAELGDLPAIPLADHRSERVKSSGGPRVIAGVAALVEQPHQLLDTTNEQFRCLRQIDGVVAGLRLRRRTTGARALKYQRLCIYPAGSPPPNNAQCGPG